MQPPVRPKAGFRALWPPLIFIRIRCDLRCGQTGRSSYARDPSLVRKACSESIYLPKDKQPFHFTGENGVTTAAHCLKSCERIKLTAGEYDLRSTRNSHRQTRHVGCGHYRTFQAPATASLRNNDIALIEVTPSFSFNGKRQCLQFMLKVFCVNYKSARVCQVTEKKWGKWASGEHLDS